MDQLTNDRLKTSRLHWGSTYCICNENRHCCGVAPTFLL